MSAGLDYVGDLPWAQFVISYGRSFARQPPVVLGWVSGSLVGLGFIGKIRFEYWCHQMSDFKAK